MLSPKLEWSLANPKWSAELNPVITNPLNNVIILKNINLSTGANVINTGLQDVQQGWFIVDINAPITVYRSSPFSKLTMSLTCSGPAVANIGVF